MKKIFLLVSLSMLVFALGCNKDPSPTNNGYKQPEYSEMQPKITRQTDAPYVHGERHYERDTGPRPTKYVRAEDVI